MENISKLFEELATNWRFDQFFKARIKLTLLYVFIVFIIIGGVSSVFYIGAKNQLDNFPKRFIVQNQQTVIPNVPTRILSMELSPEHQKIIQDIKRQLISSIVTVDISILAVVFLLSYWWAGYTLRPIKLSLDQQKRFIADAAHEFKTPLTVMKTSLDVFSRTKGDIAELLDTLKSEIQQLTAMSGQLLTLTTVDASMRATEKIDLDAILKKVTERFQRIAQEKNITLNLQTITGVTIEGVRTSVEQIFSNLVDNAIKYTAPKGSVSIRVEKLITKVKVTIEDTGSGIDPQDIPYIFNRFYQGDVSKHATGVGLGLSIVQAGVVQHNGTIEVKSAIGEGSVFTIILPMSTS